jgi:hypothetical protein
MQTVPAVGLEVTVFSLSNARRRSDSTYTDQAGMYYIHDIPPGAYNLEVWLSRDSGVLIATYRIEVSEPYTDVPPVQLPVCPGEHRSWSYSQGTGILCHETAKVAEGYSGQGEDKNNPRSQSKDGGPIPQGIYTIQGPPFNSAVHGQFVLSLIPSSSNQMFGRSGFLIHGDSVQAPGSSSQGSVVLSRTARGQIYSSGDFELHVIP